MLAIDTTQPPLFRKASIFRRFTRRERSLEISSPITPEANEWNSPQSPRSPRRLVRRSTERRPERVAEAPPTLPALNTKSTQKPRTIVTHTRADSASFPDLPISQQFSRAQPTSPAHSGHSSRSSNQSTRPSTDTTSSTHSRVSRNAHATHPFPHNTRIGPWDLFLPPSQVHALYTGFFPENTSDEWFVFSEGPDVKGKLKVHFHRAWTGLKVAELFVVMDLKGEGAGKIVGIKWNSSEQTSGIEEEEAKRTIRRGCKTALGIELEGEEF